MKSAKLKRFLTSSKKLYNRLTPTQNLEKLQEFQSIIKLLSDKARLRLLSSKESFHILQALIGKEAKDSDRRQYITQEEKDAVLDWWNNGQKNKKNYPVPEGQISVLWKEIGTYDRKLRQQLTVKGNAKYRFEETIPFEERGELILSLYIRSGKTCAITGKEHHWTNLEPDHKNPELGDVAENLLLVYAPINKSKGKKTWEEYVNYLQTYDPEKKKVEAEKRAANKAAMFVEYIDRVRSRTLDFSSAVPVPEFANGGRLKALTKLLSTNPTGKFAIVTQPSKRTSIGTVNTAYQLLRYRLGYIEFEDIPDFVWEELTRHSSRSQKELEALVKETFNPKISRTKINPKFEP